MNIFYLDHNADLAAHKHCDQHVNKMILESAQLLSTVVHLLKIEKTRPVYKPTHEKHPCTLWMTKKFFNCYWVYKLAFHLDVERKIRFNTKEPHKSLEVARNAFLLLDVNQDLFVESDCSVALAMPDECKTDDPVQAYKNYYCYKNEQWKKENRPMKYYGIPIDPVKFLSLKGTHEKVTSK